jgi:large subunit ribosomal protein L31e
MIERIYNVPLRRDVVMSPKWRRSKKAINVIQAYLVRHTKVENIKLSRWVNEAIWEKGGKNPPGKITLKVRIDKEKNIAWAELAELPKKATRKLEIKKKEEAKAKKVEEKKPKIEEIPAEEEKKDEKKEEIKAVATPTAKQEMAMHK